MTKKEYKLGALTFKTKKACEEYVRNTLSEIGCVRIGQGHPKWAFLNDIINNHPEKEIKTGLGVDYFWIMKNPRGKGLETMIKRTDGTHVDFSWTYCCKFKLRTIEDDITRAMRTAIEDYKNAFKRQFRKKFICTFCKKEGTISSDFHADHVHPFCNIKDEFLSNEPVHPTKFADNIGSTRFHEDDYEFERRWVDFHNKKAKLQILCRSCNLSKGDRLDINDRR